MLLSKVLVQVDLLHCFVDGVLVFRRHGGVLSYAFKLSGCLGEEIVNTVVLLGVVPHQEHVIFEGLDGAVFLALCSLAHFFQAYWLSNPRTVAWGKPLVDWISEMILGVVLVAVLYDADDGPVQHGLAGLLRSPGACWELGPFLLLHIRSSLAMLPPTSRRRLIVHLCSIRRSSGFLSSRLRCILLGLTCWCLAFLGVFSNVQGDAVGGEALIKLYKAVPKATSAIASCTSSVIVLLLLILRVAGISVFRILRSQLIRSLHDLIWLTLAGVYHILLIFGISILDSIALPGQARLILHQHWLILILLSHFEVADILKLWSKILLNFDGAWSSLI